MFVIAIDDENGISYFVEINSERFLKFPIFSHFNKAKKWKTEKGALKFLEKLNKEFSYEKRAFVIEVKIN